MAATWALRPTQLTGLASEVPFVLHHRLQETLPRFVGRGSHDNLAEGLPSFPDEFGDFGLKGFKVRTAGEVVAFDSHGLYSEATPLEQGGNNKQTDLAFGSVAALLACRPATFGSRGSAGKTRPLIYV